METMTSANFKSIFPALADAGQEALTLLEARSETVAVRAGSCVVEPGKLSDTLFLILSGSVRVSLEAEDECLVLGDLGPGQWVGEMGMIQPAVAVAQVVTMEDCVFLEISCDTFMALRNEAPALTSIMLRMLCNDLAGRLQATVHFIDNLDRPESTPDKSDQHSMVEAVRKLVGVAARIGA